MNPRAGRARSRRGNLSVIVAIALVALVGFGALVVDIGWARTSGTQLQSALDAAALAGAASVEDGPEAVRAQARGVAALHLAGGKAIVLEDSDIELGTWDADTHSFTATPDDTGDIVRITHELTEVSAFLGPILGKEHFDLTRSSIAGHGGARSCAILAQEGVVLDGDIEVDSYDASEGSYEDSSGSKGGVCSNGDVDCSGSGIVHGDVVYGDQLLSDCETTGEEEESEDEILLPEVDCSVPPEDSNNALVEHLMEGEALAIEEGDVLAFVEGIYFFQTLEIASNSLVTVSGDVTICIKGGKAELDADSIVNTSGDPSSFTLMVEDDSRLDLNGNGEFYGSIIAPHSQEVKLTGDLEYFGVIMARLVELEGDIGVHAEEDLIDLYMDTRRKTPSVLQ